jgi:hypothetical protein
MKRDEKAKTIAQTGAKAKTGLEDKITQELE